MTLNAGYLDLPSVEHLHMKFLEIIIYLHAKDQHEAVVKGTLLFGSVARQVLLGNSDADLADVFECDATSWIINTSNDMLLIVSFLLQSILDISQLF